MQLSIPFWQQKIFQQWKQFVQANKIPHALLIQGAAGLGKSQLVKHMLQLLFCETHSACGHCRDCHWVNQNAHPDCSWIQPEAPGKAIKIASIREALEWLQLSPLDSAKKVLVIQPAEALNTASSNALLKTLEEPSESTLIILTSEMPELLLPTVRSRCQKLCLRLPEEAETKAWLAAQANFDASRPLMPGLGPYALLEEFSETQTPIREEILGVFDSVSQRKIHFLAAADKLKSCAPLEVLRYGYYWIWLQTEKLTKIADKRGLNHWLRLEQELLQLKRSVLQGANLNWQLQLELLLEKI
ncbi:MAG: polymerase subunit delta [Gammaproteobacteria bacterium]|jgi:DNA polymerase-3 subunit delta'|nr:polymerase subunit delta [Gammaproteobacteria bacterium]